MRERNIRVLRLFMLFILAILFILISVEVVSAEKSFSVKCLSYVKGYGHNRIAVQTPESGILRLDIRDDDNVYATIEYAVTAGYSEYDWNGLGINGERLVKKELDLIAVLNTDSDNRYEYSSRLQISTSEQALVYLLPSDDTAYLGEPDQWFVEYWLNKDGIINFELKDSFTGTTVCTYSKKAKGNSARKYTLKEICGKELPLPGEYILTAWAKDNPDYSGDCQLTVRKGNCPVFPVEITEQVMPNADDTDEVIWEKMMQPATVIDINASSHQKVYEKPDIHSEVLGTLHGQTQAVEVLELTENWAHISAWVHEDGKKAEGWVPRNILSVVRPQTEYGLLIDKTQQTLTLFQNGQRVDSLLVSTGKSEPNALFQETAAGSFLTEMHRVSFSTNGLKYDYVIRYDGGNLLHQIPYAWDHQRKNFSEGRGCLGTKASHGCVRIQAESGGNGVNAYWLWTHIPYHTRVIILDDDQNSLKADNSSVIIADTYDNKNEPPDIAIDQNAVTITFGGDAVLGTRESFRSRKDALPYYLTENGYAYPFSRMKNIFCHDDLTVCNLECVLQDDPYNEAKKSYRFRGEKDNVRILKAGSIEVVDIANNHTIDYGESGYKSTLEALSGNVDFFGNGINTIITVKGHRIGFGGCRETTYLSDPHIIEKDISELKMNGAEYIVYQCHWGKEYAETHNIIQEAMARACVRAGADLVIGHHPHVVQGIQFINKTPVFYSLGNLMFGGTIDLTETDAMVVRVRIIFDEHQHYVTYSIIPIITSSTGTRKNDYCPYPASGLDICRIVEKVQKDTEFMIPQNDF